MGITISTNFTSHPQPRTPHPAPPPTPTHTLTLVADLSQLSLLPIFFTKDTLRGPKKAKVCLRACAKCIDSDIPHACAKCPPAICSILNRFIVFNCSDCGQRRPWLDCANAQADLGLRCPHISEDTFLHGTVDVVSFSRKSNRYYWNIHFNFSVDDFLNIGDDYFEQAVNNMYPKELHLNQANFYNTEA